jgi:cellulase/cellobiase CelA1
VRPTTTTAVTTTTVRPTTTTTVRPTTTTVAPGVVSATVTVNDDWGSGYCARVTVRNTSATSVVWQVNFAVQGRVTGAWNARVSQTGTLVTASGDASWNRTIAPGGSYEQFGFCAAR